MKTLPKILVLLVLAAMPIAADDLPVVTLDEAIQSATENNISLQRAALLLNQTVRNQNNYVSTYLPNIGVTAKADTGMSFTYPHMMGNALKNAKEICFRYSEYKEEIHRIYRDFHSHLFSESIPYCYQHPFVDQIESIEKDLIKGYQLREGVDFSQGMSTIDYSIKDLQGRGKTPTCKKCQYNFCCPGVWKEYIYLFKNQIDLFPIIGDVNADPRI